MPFTWVYPANPGDYAQSEEIQEIRTNTNTLATNIFSPTPASSESISFVQPLSDGILIQNQVGDELQENLDVLKSENYCRGHHNAQKIIDNVSDNVAFYELDRTDRVLSDNVTYNSSYRTTKHTDYKNVDNGNRNTSFNDSDNYINKGRYVKG